MTAPDTVPPRCVLAVGAANVDIAGRAAGALAAGDSTPGQVRSSAGGVARNVAENLARLGLPVRLLSAVGDDLHGRSVLQDTARAGVDVRDCWVLPDAATSSYLSLHGPDGEMAAAVNDMAILERITPALLMPQAGQLGQAAALLLDCNLPAETLGWLFSHSAGVPVFVDPVSAFKARRLLPWLARVHTLKANRIEAQALWGNGLGSDRDIAAAAQWLHARGVRQVVLSLGARGAYWSRSDDGAHGWQGAVPVRVASATGAGDALMAGLVYGHLQGEPFPSAVRFAAGCAALTLEAAQANHPGLGAAAVHALLARAGDPGPATIPLPS